MKPDLEPYQPLADACSPSAANGAAGVVTPRLPAAPEASTRPPTERQLEVLRFIGAFTREHCYPPTRREVCKGIGIVSTNGADDHLRALERRGLITRTPMVSRGIVITATGRALLSASISRAEGES